VPQPHGGPDPCTRTGDLGATAGSGELADKQPAALRFSVPRYVGRLALANLDDLRASSRLRSVHTRGLASGWRQLADADGEIIYGPGALDVQKRASVSIVLRLVALSTQEAPEGPGLYAIRMRKPNDTAEGPVPHDTRPLVVVLACERRLPLPHSTVTFAVNLCASAKPAAPVGPTVGPRLASVFPHLRTVVDPRLFALIVDLGHDPLNLVVAVLARVPPA